MHVEDVLSWVVIVGGVLSSAAILLGVVYWAARPVLQRWILVETQKQLAASMAPVQLQLTTMNGELTRVRVIEQKLENGMSDRLTRVEHDITAIRDHLLGGGDGHPWDGRERRR